MAEGKKTFQMYTDYLDDFELLDNHELGQVMRWVFEYVNDIDSVMPDDKALMIVCKRIRRDLKRDLENWQLKCEKNRLNGLKGGRPKNPKKPKKTERFLEKPKKADKDKDKDKDKDIVIPSLQEFKTYAKNIGIYIPDYDYEVEAKYQQWYEDGWIDGNGNKIKNWKTKLKNTMVYFKGVKQQKARTW